VILQWQIEQFFNNYTAFIHNRIDKTGCPSCVIWERQCLNKHGCTSDSREQTKERRWTENTIEWQATD